MLRGESAEGRRSRAWRCQRLVRVWTSILDQRQTQRDSTAQGGRTVVADAHSDLRLYEGRGLMGIADRKNKIYNVLRPPEAAPIFGVGIAYHLGVPG